MARALVNVPPKAKRGAVIEIKTLISHPMETGYRHDETGRAYPRDIINRFVCTYNGVEVFRADLSSGISANPYVQFYTVAEASGDPSSTSTISRNSLDNWPGSLS